MRATARVSQINEFAPVYYVFGLLLTPLRPSCFRRRSSTQSTATRSGRAFGLSAIVSLFVGAGVSFAHTGRRCASALARPFPADGPLLGRTADVRGLPFLLAGQGLSPAGAFFETVSGLTTTGSTVLVDFDDMPRGILLWRALLQGIGGIGMIAMAVAVLPFLNIGGMQLFRTESSDRSDKIMPRAEHRCSGDRTGLRRPHRAVRRFSTGAGGMTLFEAVCHAMPTLSTGGYSTSDASLAHWDQPLIHWTATVFMFLGGLPSSSMCGPSRATASDLWAQ